MSSAQVVETSANVITNSPSQDYNDPEDHTSPTYYVIDNQGRFQQSSDIFTLLNRKLGIIVSMP